MYQKCPICLGTGRTFSKVSSSSFLSCSTCNGTKIISELTGLPPNFERNRIERQKENDLSDISNELKVKPYTPF